MLNRPISLDTSVNPNEEKEVQDDEKRLGIMKFIDIFMFFGFTTTFATITFACEYNNFPEHSKK